MFVNIDCLVFFRFKKIRRSVSQKGPQGPGRNSARSGKRYRGYPSTQVNVPRFGPTIFPDRQIVKLRYSDSGTGTSTAGAAWAYVYAGNNVFDPDFTGVGSQPLGYSIYADNYRRYNVRASAIQFQLVPSTTTTMLTSAMIAGVFPSTLSGTLPTNMNDFMSQPYVNYKMPVAQWGSLTSNTMNNYMSTSKLMGVLPHAAQDESYSGSVSSGTPGKPWYWVLSAACADLTSTGTVIWIVHIDYYIEFYDRYNIIAQ